MMNRVLSVFLAALFIAGMLVGQPALARRHPYVRNGIIGGGIGAGAGALLSRRGHRGRGAAKGAAIGAGAGVGYTFLKKHL